MKGREPAGRQYEFTVHRSNHLCHRTDVGDSPLTLAMSDTVWRSTHRPHMSAAVANQILNRQIYSHAARGGGTGSQHGGGDIRCRTTGEGRNATSLAGTTRLRPNLDAPHACSFSVAASTAPGKRVLRLGSHIASFAPPLPPIPIASP